MVERLTHNQKRRPAVVVVSLTDGHGVGPSTGRVIQAADADTKPLLDGIEPGDVGAVVERHDLVGLGVPSGSTTPGVGQTKRGLRGACEVRPEADPTQGPGCGGKLEELSAIGLRHV